MGSGGLNIFFIPWGRPDGKSLESHWKNIEVLSPNRFGAVGHPQLVDVHVWWPVSVNIGQLSSKEKRQIALVTHSGWNIPELGRCIVFCSYLAHPTDRKWVTTLVINGISGVSPLISGVISHLLSGMNHIEPPSSKKCNNSSWLDLVGHPPFPS